MTCARSSPDAYVAQNILSRAAAGERDPICPAPQTQALADYFKAQGTATEIEWHAGGHDIRQNEISAIERFIKG